MACTCNTVAGCRTRSIFVPPVEPIIEKTETTKKGGLVVKHYDALNRLVGKHGVTVGEIRSRLPNKEQS